MARMKKPETGILDPGSITAFQMSVIPIYIYIFSFCRHNAAHVSSQARDRSLTLMVLTATCVTSEKMVNI